MHACKGTFPGLDVTHTDKYVNKQIEVHNTK